MDIESLVVELQNGIGPSAARYTKLALPHPTLARAKGRGEKGAKQERGPGTTHMRATASVSRIQVQVKAKRGCFQEHSELEGFGLRLADTVSNGNIGYVQIRAKEAREDTADFCQILPGHR